ncbi:FliM/FliN family flagellar motor C-terminal domain-containing protein [Paracoccus benzoatiresistens]|uniref:FliM/FliN family flagellar motor C-terminal domain-containing protein n=1 Tax=Paracoccus benzoatiresistens TaxID=2997341 RepID=A0ABT4J221_9RHOB|nr:FliM/FliN family flagellar motor C-terminal domain-containing protein [Paracoccus sp. EF6]MCZ0961140.1 FliM/FliN family flagellar motor C-terminal domain-containing protein [Paracoccus sp. EF6]
MAQPGQAGRLRALLQARAQGGKDKPARLPQPQPLSPARAAANAVGRALERLYRLPVLPIDIQSGAATLAELPELLPDQSLLVVLQGPGDQIGAMALGFDTVTALIEVQALGRVTARPAERRKLTRSDAAICVDFVNALMAELGAEMGAVEGFGPIQGYRYATYLDDPRPLVLMLEDRPYRSLSFELRFGGAETRDGRILIAVPHKAEVRPAAPPAAAALPAPAAVPQAPSLAGAMAAAPVEVVGVLCRRTVTLGELRALVPGRLLPLPRVNLAEARLETRDGQLLATGKLGESEGCHALRLHDPSRPAAEQPSHRAGLSPVLPPADLSGSDPFRAAADAQAAAGEKGMVGLGSGA